MKPHQNLPAFIWDKIRDRSRTRRFEERLPNASRAELEGVLIDISGFDVYMKRVILEGRYEASERAICSKLIGPGERILELGAAIGSVGLFCLLGLKAAKVVAVEANPATVEFLRRNYALNNIKPTVIEAAVAAKDEPIKFNTSPRFWSDSVVMDGAAESLTAIEVNGMTLPSILAQTQETFSALIVDIEGAEASIAWEDLPRSIKKIIFETHPRVLGFPAAYKIVCRLMNVGFEVSSYTDDVFGLIRS